jgi:hypothetical protein
VRIDPARVAALARADLLERTRRPAFLVLLGVGLWAAWLFTPPNHSAYATFRMASARGLYGSAWIGATVALLTAGFFSLAGFFVVKNAIAGDRDTRVGEILATSTTSNVEYVLGKWLANTSILWAFTLVMMVGAALMQPARGEDPILRPWALAAPFLWVTLPAMAVTAALAVVFEAIPGIRGGPGNVAYFFVWGIALLAPSTKFGQEAGFWDPLGFQMLVAEMLRAGREAIPGFRADLASFSIGFNFREGGWHLETFAWEGVRWTPSLVLPRLAWLAGAGILAALAAVPFDRFSGETPGRSHRRGSKAAPTPERSVSGSATTREDAVVVPASAAWSALAPVTRGFSGVTLALAELRLLAGRSSRWWWLTWAAVQVPAVLMPQDLAPRFAALGWIWPVFRWSELGARDRVNGTTGLLDSSPHPIARQLPAAWAAGACLALLAGAGFGVRSLLSGSNAVVAGWIAGAVFVPALALALGTLSRGRKTFEILFVVLWYVGPLNGVPIVDFTGASGGSAAPVFALGALAAMGVAAWTRRVRILSG